MGTFLDENFKESVKGKYCQLDNDFLGALFSDNFLFLAMKDLLNDYPFVYDNLTSFEFFRDIFVPNQIELREKFLSKDIFFPLTDHQEIYTKTQTNALILSKIYAQNDSKLKIKNTASFVDIYMASRLMSLGSKYLLITGNKKDFPSYIFDTKGIIVNEEANGFMRNYSLLAFNPDKFDKCFEELGRVGNNA